MGLSGCLRGLPDVRGGMMAWLAGAYLWIKALHVISMIAWMAGMLYLPRLFVYHCQAAAGSEASEMLKVMERRLLRVIITPAMVATLVFGLLLAATPGAVDWSSAWPYLKIVFLLGMFALYDLNVRWRRAFAEDRNTREARFYRIANEAPTALMVAIVVVAVVKPF